MKITEMSSENRPRERLEAQGAAALSHAELLAIILKSGTQKENVLEICQKLCAKYSLEQLADCSLQELMSEHGIGKAKASQLVAVFELLRRARQFKTSGAEIRKAEDVAKLYQHNLSHLKHEQFLAVYVDPKNRVIAEEIITKGILNASLIHPREVFHGAIRHLAHALIVIHNHPSGDPAPSEEDIEVTRKLAKTGEIMGIPLLDHVILAKEKWWSWREKG